MKTITITEDDFAEAFANAVVKLDEQTNEDKSHRVSMFTFAVGLLISKMMAKELFGEKEDK